MTRIILQILQEKSKKTNERMMLMKSYLDMIEYTVSEGERINISFAQFILMISLSVFAAMILHHMLQQPRLYIIPSYKLVLRSYWNF